jgi:opacity protein-like surface antigen
MKKLVLVAVFVMGFSIAAVAQELPAYQYFGGYSSLHAEAVRAWQRNTPRAKSDLNGWDLSVALNGTKNAALVVDVTGHYGKVGSPNWTSGTPELASIKYPRNYKAHTLMFGPKYSVTIGKFAPFAQSLLGIVHINLGGLRTRQTTNNFGFTAGGGLDVAVNDKFGIRAFQAQYLQVRNGGFMVKEMMVSAGLIYKGGKRYN